MTLPDNLLPYLLVIAAYFALFVAIPFWVRGFRFRDENTAEKIVSTLLFSHLAIIFVVFILTFVGVYYRFSLILSLLFVCVGYRYLANPNSRGAFLTRLVYHAKNLADSVELPQVVMKNWRRSLKAGFILIAKKITNPFAFAVTVGIFAYRIYITSYHSLFNSFFGTSDMYVHTQWIKHMQVNEPFFGGVYPLGFHAVAMAVADVFGFNIVTVMQMIGSVMGFMLLYILYFLLSKTMRSHFAINLVLALFVLPELFPNWATDRHFLALPQEYGAIFLYLTAYYLWSYLKAVKGALKQADDSIFFESYDLVDIKGLKKKGSFYRLPYGSTKWYLVHFAITVSLTVLVHPFITVFAGILCGFIFLTHLHYLNWKAFGRLVAAVAIAFTVAILPLALGLLKGIPLNGSFTWAAEVLTETGVEIEFGAVDVQTEDEHANYPYKNIFDYIFLNMKWARQFEKYDDLDQNWFAPALLILLFGIIAGFLPYRNRPRSEIFAAFSLYSITLVILYILSFLSIFALMEDSRLYTYFIYSLPLSLAVLPELFHSLLGGNPDLSATRGRVKKVKTKLSAKIKLAVYICAVIAVSVGGSYVIYQNYGMLRLQRVSMMQYNGAIKAYYQIRKEFPRNGWVVISSFAEYAQIFHDGYHFNISDFVFELELYEDQEPFEMEAENIFLYIVKKPNKYNYVTSLVRLGEDPGLPPYDPDLVNIDLTAEAKDYDSYTIYSDLRLTGALQAKANAWAEEFKRNFPAEISVYYDDEDIRVYRIKQNIYDLNNFRIGD